MASAPFASWNSRSITHLASCRSPSLPMNSSDESELRRAEDKHTYITCASIYLGRNQWINRYGVEPRVPQTSVEGTPTVSAIRADEHSAAQKSNIEGACRQ